MQHKSKKKLLGDSTQEPVASFSFPKRVWERKMSRTCLMRESSTKLGKLRADTLN